MSATYTAVILLSLLSCLTTSIGVVLALWLRESARAIAAGIGFSVGIMVQISALELVPQAIEAMGVGATLGSAGAGVALVWAANFVVPHTHLTEEKGMAGKAVTRSAYLVVFGLVLHDVPEGFAMANAYVAAPALGVLVALAIALHNLPEEFAMSVPAVMTRSKRFLFGAAALSALAEPAGAVIGLVAVRVAPALNPHFMAFAAGAMLFVSIHELVPMARRYGRFGFFVRGFLVSALVYAILASVTGNVGKRAHEHGWRAAARTTVQMRAATPLGVKTSAAEERPRMVRRESGVGHPAQ
jgi:zinc transporter, ZIP family